MFSKIVIIIIIIILIIITIKINSNFEKTKLLDIICGVPQGSIFGPYLSILYINDLCFVSHFLKPVVFVDYTDLFCAIKEIKLLFFESKFVTCKISEWFI